jgi:diguanylate cyclase (GGDEF)-like protein
MRLPLLPHLLAATLLIAPAARAQNAPSASPEALIAEAERLQESNPEAALALAQRGLALATATHNAALIARAHRARCWSAVPAQPDSILSYAEQGLAAAARSGDAAAIARMRICRAYGRDHEGQVLQAIEDYDFAAREGARLHNDSIRATAQMYRGEIHYYRGDFHRALVDLTAAYDIFTKMSWKDRELYTLNAMANVYADTRVGEYDKAIEYYQQILPERVRQGNQLEIGVTYFNLGSTYESKGDLKQALSYFNRALEIDLQRNDPAEVATDKRSIGVVLNKLDRPAEALVMLDQALAYWQKDGNAERIGAVQIPRAAVLRKLGRCVEVLEELNEARDVFAASDNKRFLVRIDEENALCYASLGNYEAAYDALSSQLALQKELGDNALGEQTTRMRVQFDAEKKEQENRTLMLEKTANERVRKLQLAVLLLSMVVMAGLLALAVRQIRNARRLRIVALTDELTGVPNRRHLMLVAAESFKHARGANRPLGVLAVDLNRFKQINDTFGHGVGDAVLQRVAAALQGALRDDDIVGRIGGDEFIVLLPGASSEIADDVARRIHEVIAATHFGDITADLKVDVCIGAAQISSNDGSIDDVIKRADDALYAAKSHVRNQMAMKAV